VSAAGLPIGRIVSGGQSGVDRAALDFAIAHGIDYGGWCPRGGWAEDHPTPPGLLASYPRLRETPSHDADQRTVWNVRDSHATLVLRLQDGRTSPGTALTVRVAGELDRPLRVVLLPGAPAESRAAVWRLIGMLPGGGVLNVAGPRESEAPGIYRRSLCFLEAVLLVRLTDEARRT
jgi:hypothetical protein